MKTTIALLIALGTLSAVANVTAGDKASCSSCCKDGATALSPRAQASQTMVSSGKSDADLARADLGTGARSKAFSGYTGSVGTGSAQNADFGRDRALGVAAKAKASGNTGSATIELAPLK